jgi:hypothetical protein
VKGEPLRKERPTLLFLAADATFFAAFPTFLLNKEIITFQHQSAYKK